MNREGLSTEGKKRLCTVRAFRAEWAPRREREWGPARVVLSSVSPYPSPPQGGGRLPTCAPSSLPSTISTLFSFSSWGGQSIEGSLTWSRRGGLERSDWWAGCGCLSQTGSEDAGCTRGPQKTHERPWTARAHVTRGGHPGCPWDSPEQSYRVQEHSLRIRQTSPE